MSEMKHTPGPWRLDEDWIAIHFGPSSGGIAIHPETPNGLANAHLMAASPAMFEALRPFAAVAEHDIGDDEDDADFFRAMERHNKAPRLTVGDFRRALAALSKATPTRNQESPS